MLQDWTGVHIPKVLGFIYLCKLWDRAISLVPNQEGHDGGSTFCAVASLVLMDKVEEVLGKFY